MNGRQKRRGRAERSRNKPSPLHPTKPFPCINCGQPGPHFVPPSFGDPGFYLCLKENTDMVQITTDEQTLEEMQAEVLEVNLANGWFEEDRTAGDDIALLHSEVSEALEAFRVAGFDDMTVQEYNEDGYRTGRRMPGQKPEGFGSEMADILIRLLDTCERRGINLRAEYVDKIAYNRTRGHRHGGKTL